MCGHANSISTITAGLERVVCEDCGHVSVKYVSEVVKIFPDFEDLNARVESHVAAAPPTGRRLLCGRCDSPAEFMIPRGLACADHAWAAASRQDTLGQELWIPIRIDQNANTTG
jgi:hypothetical protein